MSDDTPKPGTQLAQVNMQSSGAGAMLMPQTLKDVVSFAEVMSRADVALPKHLRSNPGACLAVAMQAFRWEMDPFAVANKSYVVNDRIAYEAQLVAAVVLTRAPVLGRPDYSFSGEAATRRCKVEITMKDGQVLEYESPMFKDILTKNSPLWKADLDQQLGYFAIRSWARRHTPEVILGVYTPDEVEVMRDVTPRETGLSAKLAAGGAQVGGFSPGNVEAALDAEFVESLPEAPEGSQSTIDEVLAGDDLPEGLRATSAPESDRLLVPMDDLTRDERVAWVEAFKARCLREKTATGLMEVWRKFYDLQLTPLYGVDKALYEQLEAWFAGRMKKTREDEKKPLAT